MKLWIMSIPLKWVPLLVLVFASCDSNDSSLGSEAAESRFVESDERQQKVIKNIGDLKMIATIDHARLAAKEGVNMPPCVASIFGSPKINTPLVKLDPRIGLDLPLKVLVYEETGETTVAYVDSDFMVRRHGIANTEKLKAYDQAMQSALRDLPENSLSPVARKNLEKNYGIVEIVSDFDLDQSIANLKKAVMSQGDTLWFGEIDYQAEAAGLGEEIPGATLLLFGGPKPGGVAMAEFPRLGLDAFCQKLLVYEEKDGPVKIIFNDIVALSELHYGESIEEHKGLTDRLTQTFKDAVTK